MKRLFLVASIWLCWQSGCVWASEGASSIEAPPSLWMARIQQLESETAAMRAEIEFLREHAQPQGGVAAMPVTTDMTTSTNETTEGEGLYDGEDLLQQMKDLVWTKGDYKVVPYGNIWGSAAYDTQRSFPGAFVLYVFSENLEDEDTFIIDTRRTRLGLDITGPKIPFFHNANSRGRVEIDFHGQFATIQENQANVQIRHGYAEVYDEYFRLMAGQTWDLASPLLPHTVSYSVGWGGGNIGFRRMQVRYERYLSFSDAFQVTPALAVCQNIITDAPITDREPTDWPVLEGRLGFTLGPRGEGCKPVAFGVSGHIGEQGFDFSALGNLPAIENARVRTWSFNADVLVPITERLSFQGEFFTGADLGTLLGGVVQGVDLARREAIHSTGGWFEFGFDWTDRLHSYVGYGIDDPRNDDLTFGRTLNRFVFANTFFDVTKKLKLGAEVTSWRTQWLTLAPGDDVRLECAGHYDF